MHMKHVLTGTLSPRLGIPHLCCFTDAGVNQVRRQEVNSFDVSQAVSTLSTAQAADMSAIREMMSTMMGPQSPITATVNAVAADMTSRTMGLMSAATANEAQLRTVTDNLNGLTASVDVQLAAAQESQNAAQAAMTVTLTTSANSSEQPVPPPITCYVPMDVCYTMRRFLGLQLPPALFSCLRLPPSLPPNGDWCATVTESDPRHPCHPFRRARPSSQWPPEWRTWPRATLRRSRLLSPPV